MREILGEAADWSTDTHLLAVVADSLHAANWQRGGNKNAPRPKPLPRPKTPTEVSAEEARRQSRLSRLRRIDATTRADDTTEVGEVDGC